MKHNTPAQEAKSLGTLFFTFFKIGLFTFGGGYAMIALLEEEFIQRRKWLDKDEFLDMTAIAESTPGPVAINSATYLGYKLAGVPGAATATVAVCLPSFLIIYAISLFFEQFTQLTVIANAFKGIQVCVIYLIFSAGVRMLKALDKSPFATGVLAAAGVVDLKSSKEETTKAGAVTWQKVDKNAAALTGAEFQVYEGDVSGLSADELKAKTPLKFNSSNGAYSLPTANADGTYPEGATDTLQSNAEGKYTLNGLKLNTTYTVIETKVPTGYNGTFVGKFTITTGATADAAATFAGKDAWNLSKDNKGTFQVTNVKNITQLPLTGAAGTMLFSVIGLLIAGAAVTVFVKSRSTKRALNA